MEWGALSQKFRFTTPAINDIPLAKSDSHRLEYRDTQQPGLVLRVGKQTKTYYLYTRIERVDGSLKEAKIRLGRTDRITLQEVRQMVRTKLGGEDVAGSDALPPGLAAAVRFDEELLTTAEAAALTKMSVAWFERKRWERVGGPPYRRRGRSIRYLKSELLAWWIAER